MADSFIIIGGDGQPLCDLDGKRIECASRAEAEQFLKHGERVMPVRGRMHLPPAKARA